MNFIKFDDNRALLPRPEFGDVLAEYPMQWLLPSVVTMMILDTK